MGAMIVAIVNDEKEAKSTSKTRQMMRASEEGEDVSDWSYISFPALRDVEWAIKSTRMLFLVVATNHVSIT